ncbi:hypothetical protein ACJX0J_035069 [Zea mays]
MSELTVSDGQRIGKISVFASENCQELSVLLAFWRLYKVAGTRFIIDFKGHDIMMDIHRLVIIFLKEGNYFTLWNLTTSETMCPMFWKKLIAFYSTASLLLITFEQVLGFLVLIPMHHRNWKEKLMSLCLCCLFLKLLSL